MKNTIKTKKGAFFTIDSILAILILIIILPLVMLNIRPVSQESNINSFFIEDISEYMLVNDIFKEIITTSSSAEEMRRQIPSNLCLDIEIKTSSGTPVFYSDKSCVGADKKETSWRSFFTNNVFYFGKNTICMKKQCCSKTDCGSNQSCINGKCQKNVIFDLELDFNYNDKSDKSFNFTCTDCPTWNESSISYRFNGINDYLLRNEQTWNISNEWTVISWINPETLQNSGENTILNLGQLSELNNSIRLSLVNKKINIVTGKEDGSSNMKNYTGNSEIKLNKWQQIAVSWDGTDINIYLNAKKDIPYTKNEDNLDTMKDSFRRITIGSDLNHNYFFNGSIDNTIVFNRTLTQSEIIRLYEEGRT